MHTMVFTPAMIGYKEMRQRGSRICTANAKYDIILNRQ